MNIYYLYGPETLDDVIFDILRDKSEVVSNSLDGKISNYHIKKALMDECVEEVKELKSKGVLNPIIIKKSDKSKTDKSKIDSFFSKQQKSLTDFVARKSKVKAEPEDIENDSDSELLLQALDQLKTSDDKNQD